MKDGKKKKKSKKGFEDIESQIDKLLGSVEKSASAEANKDKFPPEY